MDLLETTINKHITPYANKSIWLAVSGGVDSMVLMSVCAQLYQKQKIASLTVVYVNHQLHPNAKEWGRLVQEHGKKYGLVVKLLVVDCHNEESARDARYQAIFSQMDKDDVLLTAHHLNDQHETFFFRVLRGTSLQGLVGLRKQHVLHGYTVLRPLLDICKDQILTYAHSNGLKWCEDPSNTNTDIVRNEIRHALTHIKNKKGFLLTHSHLQTQSEVLYTLLDDKLQTITPKPHVFCLKQSGAVSKAVQQALFHQWLTRIVGPISHIQTQTVFTNMLHAQKDRQPEALVGDYTLRRYRHELFILRLPSLIPNITSNSEWIDLGDIGKIHNPQQRCITIGCLGDMKGQYKKRLQQLGIPLCLRPYIPCLLDDNTLVLEHPHMTWHMPTQWEYWINK